jgi:hypothetical protein
MHNLALKIASGLPVDSDRDAVLARCRRYRALSREYNSRLLRYAPRDIFLNEARRLGLARGETLLTDEPDALCLAYDLAIHTAPPERTRVIDRYARTAGVEAGSDNERVLEAMRRGRFAILGVAGRHERRGLVVFDPARSADLWLVDEPLATPAKGGLFATRLFEFDDFHITAGVVVPVDEALLRNVVRQVPFLADRPWPGMLADGRFAEATYRLALAGGRLEEIRYRNAIEDPKAA